ncbi:hypothetical protein MTP03_09940 [Tsukamurella sp. PLM1]|nr:hypothetical protein MTP03_09940 [Tsukamurella sp. PLM1]
MFVVATIERGGEERVHDTLGDLSALVRSVGFRYPDKRLTLITSIGSEAWDRLFAGPKPAGLHPFVELDGPRHRAVHSGRSAAAHQGGVAGHVLRARGPYPRRVR